MPLVGPLWFHALRRRPLVFEFIQHRLILGAQRCRGLHGHPGRHGVARIAPAPSLHLAQDGVEFGVKRRTAVWIPRSSLSWSRNLLNLPGELRRSGFATTTTGIA